MNKQLLSRVTFGLGALLLFSPIKTWGNFILEFIDGRLGGYLF